MNKREEERLRKQQEKLQKELERLETMRIYEKEYASCKYICGIDEVGLSLIHIYLFGCINSVF